MVGNLGLDIGMTLPEGVGEGMEWYLRHLNLNVGLVLGVTGGGVEVEIGRGMISTVIEVGIGIEIGDIEMIVIGIVIDVIVIAIGNVRERVIGIEIGRGTVRGIRMQVNVRVARRSCLEIVLG